MIIDEEYLTQKIVNEQMNIHDNRVNDNFLNCLVSSIRIKVYQEIIQDYKWRTK